MNLERLVVCGLDITYRLYYSDLRGRKWVGNQIHYDNGVVIDAHEQLAVPHDVSYDWHNGDSRALLYLDELFEDYTVDKASVFGLCIQLGSIKLRLGRNPTFVILRQGYGVSVDDHELASFWRVLHCVKTLSQEQIENSLHYDYRPSQFGDPEHIIFGFTFKAPYDKKDDLFEALRVLARYVKFEVSETM